MPCMPKRKSVRRLERIVFVSNGRKWVLKNDQSKVVNPKPIGYAISHNYCWDDGISEEEIEKIAREHKRKKGRNYQPVNAYSVDSVHGWTNPASIQLFEI